LLENEKDHDIQSFGRTDSIATIDENDDIDEDFDNYDD
jgi:hypothetical protein